MPSSALEVPNEGSATAALADTTSRTPAHEMVYRDLRDRILFGEMAPGQAVTIQGLTEIMGAGSTPVREAIRRLIAEDALHFLGNRRVCVPVLSRQNIQEIVYLREAVEPELMRRAALRAKPEDIDNLDNVDAAVDRAILRGDVRAYLEGNHQFHMGIYALADAPILTKVVGGLWLRFGPSLRVVCGRMGTQNLPDRHKDALGAMRRGDADAAAEAMRQDLLQGMEVVDQVLAGGA